MSNLMTKTEVATSTSSPDCSYCLSISEAVEPVDTTGFLTIIVVDQEDGSICRPPDQVQGGLPDGEQSECEGG